MAKYIVFAAFLAVCAATGPTRPLLDEPCTEGLHIVDDENMCWFWKCVLGVDEEGSPVLQKMPMVCALGSKVSYNFISGFHNPCTINFDSPIGYACERDRPSVDGPPDCHPKTCENGGTPVYEANLCWCQCPVEWQGDHDCSLPTRDPELLDLAPLSNLCVDGEPMEDWCATPNACQNGGTCFNQCDTHYCLCHNRDEVNYHGKSCELA